ncbi:6,7-dimethyl-8-ribityllumazine synthase [bacterium]|nr:6,7-dimethyl-8-ribityllumazine synthase [bacterium]MBU0899542.1 6,7-dimethyl-8-ribityllumazine synthase [bacterium]MBU1152502.1 6,7-dimethyl-8-ribityllumazine synthase [bacterium]MBU2599167.1 6,7-dimethyl-8-ribityllumazine synthase [bacterium]
MPKICEGSFDAKGLKFALIISRFNEFITKRLEEGALDALLRNSALDDNITIYRVPGSFEIPYLAFKLAKNEDFNAIICLGTIIRGSTPHFEYICNESAKGIAQAAISSGKPVIYGIITADTIEQAIERAGTKSGNKGFDAAITAIEMANLYKNL